MTGGFESAHADLKSVRFDKKGGPYGSQDKNNEYSPNKNRSGSPTKSVKSSVGSLQFTQNRV